MNETNRKAVIVWGSGRTCGRFWVVAGILSGCAHLYEVSCHRTEYTGRCARLSSQSDETPVSTVVIFNCCVFNFFVLFVKNKIVYGINIQLFLYYFLMQQV